jgi:hypothetical protein
VVIQEIEKEKLRVTKPSVMQVPSKHTIRFGSNHNNNNFKKGFLEKKSVTQKSCKIQQRSKSHKQLFDAAIRQRHRFIELASRSTIGRLFGKI